MHVLVQVCCSALSAGYQVCCSALSAGYQVCCSALSAGYQVCCSALRAGYQVCCSALSAGYLVCCNALSAGYQVCCSALSAGYQVCCSARASPRSSSHFSQFVHVPCRDAWTLYCPVWLWLVEFSGVVLSCFTLSRSARKTEFIHNYCTRCNNAVLRSECIILQRLVRFVIVYSLLSYSVL